MSYSNRTILSNINNTQSMHDEPQPKSNTPERRQEHTQTIVNNTRGVNNNIQQVYWQPEKSYGQLPYFEKEILFCVTFVQEQGMEGQSGSQTDYHINSHDLADKLGSLKSHMANCLIFVKETLFHMTFVQPADLAHSTTNSSILHCTLTRWLLGHPI